MTWKIFLWVGRASEPWVSKFVTKTIWRVKNPILILSLSLSSSSLNKSNFHISAKPQSPLGSHPQCYGPNLLSFKREEKLVDPIRIPPSRARINQVGDNSNIKNLGSWRDFLMVVFVYSSTLAIPSSPQRPSGKIAVDSKMFSHAKEPVET